MRKPISYWKDFENVRKDLEKIAEELGHFPTHRELSNLNRSDLIYAMRYHGGLIGVRKKSGYNSIRKSPGYWKDFENVKRELVEVIGQLGHFPSNTELQKVKKSGLCEAITDYHGGFSKVAEKIGHIPSQKSRGLKEFGNMKSELEKVIKSLGHFPSHEELKVLNKHKLFNAISEYHGGLAKLADSLGYQYFRKPKGYWENFKNVEKRLNEISHNLGHFPSHRELIRLNEQGLSNAVRRCHDGLLSVAEKLGYDVSRKKDYWVDFENVRRDLEKIIRELQHFPTSADLRRLQRFDLLQAINRRGGLFSVAQRMGFQSTRKPKNYWGDFKNVETELVELIKQLEHFPSGGELMRLNKPSLLNAIRVHHGGILKVAEKMGYGQIIPKGLEQEFSFNVENDKQALEILHYFSDNPKDAADLLMALNPEKFRHNTYRILSLGKYLGKFKAGNHGIPKPTSELMTSLEELVDRNELARDILFRKAFDSYERQYQEDKTSTLQELEERCKNSDGALQTIYQGIIKELREIDKYEIPGINMELRR